MFAGIGKALGSKEPAPAGKSEPNEDDGDGLGLDTCSSDIIAAVASKDVGKLSAALRDAFGILQK